MNTKKAIYKDRYAVFDNGGIVGIRGKLLADRVNQFGYSKIAIYHKGKITNEFRHRIIAMCFIPNPEKKPQVNHIDGNKLNNNASNLEWTTNRENQRHAWDSGLMENARANSRKTAKRMGKKYGPITGKLRGRKVLNTDTGEVYQSAREVSKKIKVNYATFKNWLSGRVTNKTNFKYL